MSFWPFGKKSAAQRLSLARKAVAESRWESAESLLVPLRKEGFEPGETGHLLAQCRYAVGHPEEAFVAAKDAAEAGSAAAMFMLHQLYLTGTGTAASEAEAMRYCFAAADAGFARAAYNVAAFSVSGDNGFQRNHREAVKWYQRAMELGSPQAAFNLGMLLVEGDPEVRDRNEAARAFLRSAQLEYPTVETLLQVASRVSDQDTLSFIVATACAIDPSIAPRLLGRWGPP